MVRLRARRHVPEPLTLAQHQLFADVVIATLVSRSLGALSPSDIIDNSITSINNTIGGLSLGAQTHPISDVINLQTELNNRSVVGHEHVITDIVDLSFQLSQKASINHTHVIGDVANLQITLNDKSNVGHTHVITDVLGLQSALDQKLDVSVQSMSATGQSLFDVSGTTLKLCTLTDSGMTSIYENAGIIDILSNMDIDDFNRVLRSHRPTHRRCFRSGTLQMLVFGCGRTR